MVFELVFYYLNVAHWIATAYGLAMTGLLFLWLAMKNLPPPPSLRAQRGNPWPLDRHDLRPRDDEAVAASR
jgi:hypothetical protein